MTSQERFFWAAFILVVCLGVLATVLFTRERSATVDVYIQGCEAMAGVAVEGPNHRLGCVAGRLLVTP